MRLGVFIVCFGFALSAARAMAAEQHVELVVQDPFIELRTGPGRGYPVFYIAERGETITVLRRRTDWFQVEVPRGETGWVDVDRISATLGPDGEPFAVPTFSLEDYTARRFEFGVQYGDFGGADAVAAYAAYGLTENLQLEIWFMQALGQFSNSEVVNLNITHLMFPDRRFTPFFTLGTGTVKTSPKATLVETTDRRDKVAVAGFGLRTYLTRRFIFRTEYKAYVAFTNRDDNEEVREWKAGFSFFF